MGVGKPRSPAASADETNRTNLDQPTAETDQHHHPNTDTDTEDRGQLIVKADRYHRHHATCELAIRDLKTSGGLAHLPLRTLRRQRRLAPLRRPSPQHLPMDRPPRTNTPTQTTHHRTNHPHPPLRPPRTGREPQRTPHPAPTRPMALGHHLPNHPPKPPPASPTLLTHPNTPATTTTNQPTPGYTRPEPADTDRPNPHTEPRQLHHNTQNTPSPKTQPHHHQPPIPTAPPQNQSVDSG